MTEGNGRAPRPRYPAYRPSGVEWLGEIPAHWEAKQVRRIFTVVNGSTPSSAVQDYWDGDIIWVTPEDLGKLASNTIRDSCRHITRNGYMSCGTTLAPAESLVLSTRAPIGHLAIAGCELCTNQGCRCLVFRRKAVTRYFYYQFVAARDELRSWGQGSTFQELGNSRLAAIRLACPSLPEQFIIAAFLDRETARLDALLAAKQRLLGLLAEKRAALITRAVTRGLDPSIPLKESGVQWLNHVPVHWEGMSLKRWVEVRITDGPHETPDFLDEGIIFVSAEAVSNGRIHFEQARGCISPQLHAKYIQKCHPQRDDLLLCKSGATTGKMAIVDVDIEFSVWSPLALIRASRKKILPQYLFCAIQADYVQNQIRQTWSAGTQPNIAMSDIERLFVVAPGLQQQQALVDYLDRQTARLDALADRVRRAMDLLREYRAALITAAVTGQIDVRGGGG
jgi:type I restriction enzyme S subunit